MMILDAIRIAIRHGIRAVAVWLDRVTRGALTPDSVTLIGVLMHVPIAVLIGEGYLVVAALMLVFFGLFDVLDGELARLQKRASPKGMVLDATTDRIKEVLIFAGVAYYISNSPQAEWAFVAVLAAGLSISVSYAKAKGEAALAVLRHTTDHHKLNRHFKEGLVPFEIRMTIVIIGLLFGQLLWATVLIAVLASITIVGRLQNIAKELS